MQLAPRPTPNRIDFDIIGFLADALPGYSRGMGGTWLSHDIDIEVERSLLLMLEPEFMPMITKKSSGQHVLAVSQKGVVGGSSGVVCWPFWKMSRNI